MTLKPIPGAPVGAPIPDFPIGVPGPLVLPAGHLARPFSTGHSGAGVALATDLALAPARQTGPVEIRGSGDSVLIFRCFPEMPAISRSSMTISITGEPAGDFSPSMNLATDDAKAFLLALRAGHVPPLIANGVGAFQVEVSFADDGPAFIVSKPGQPGGSRRFNMGRGYDVKAMAERLLADLGP